MTSTRTTPRARLQPGGDPGFLVRLLAVAIMLFVVMVGTPALTHGPSFVDRVRVVNPTGMPIEMSVGEPGSSSWLPIGSVPARSRSSFGDVVDMGDSWEIRLVANGGAQVATTVSRADLARNGWTFTVPESLRVALVRSGGIAGLRD